MLQTVVKVTVEVTITKMVKVAREVTKVVKEVLWR